MDSLNGSYSRKIAKNATIIAAGRIVSAFLAAFTSILLIHYLGPERTGDLSFVVVYISIFSIFVNFGIDEIVIREISKDIERGKKFIGNAIIIKSILALCNISIAIAIASFLSFRFSQQRLGSIYIYSLSLIIFVFGPYNASFYAALKQGTFVIFGLIKQIIELLFTLLLIKCGWGLETYFILRLTAALIVQPWILWSAKKLYKANFKPNRSMITYLLKNSLPIALSSSVIFIYMRIDQIMIDAMVNKKALGMYSAAVRYCELFNLIPTALIISSITIITKLYNENYNEFNILYNRILRFLNLIAYPVIIISFINSDYIMTLIFGSDFLPASNSVKILCWSLVSSFMGIIYYQVLIAANLQKENLILAIISSATNVILNLIFIPFMKERGAALATAISYFIIFPLGLVFESTKKLTKNVLKEMGKQLFIAIIVLFIFYYLKLHLILNLILIPVIYLSLVIAFRVLDFEELKKSLSLISSIIRRKKDSM
jgi:O-antigen/teichoic acid export membrane protein